MEWESHKTSMGSFKGTLTGNLSGNLIGSLKGNCIRSSAGTMMGKGNMEKGAESQVTARGKGMWE